jgi:hypothetical protein
VRSGGAGTDGGLDIALSSATVVNNTIFAHNQAMRGAHSFGSNGGDRLGGGITLGTAVI